MAAANCKNLEADVTIKPTYLPSPENDAVRPD